MKAGDSLLWHPCTIHGSSANFSNNDRKGIVMVFVEEEEARLNYKDLVTGNFELKTTKMER